MVYTSKQWLKVHIKEINVGVRQHGLKWQLQFRAIGYYYIITQFETWGRIANISTFWRLLCKLDFSQCLLCLWELNNGNESGKYLSYLLNFCILLCSQCTSQVLSCLGKEVPLPFHCCWHISHWYQLLQMLRVKLRQPTSMKGKTLAKWSDATCNWKLLKKIVNS